MPQPAPPEIPRATARLQLHADFTFADAAALIPYYSALGISHLYLSPITTARPGSAHGYDVTDYTQISPALGGEAAFRLFAAQARAAGLGIVIDIVPNHMAADATHNAWWRDVLARGIGSPFAHVFDIDWHAPDPAVRGKVLLPILSDTYWRTLQSGAFAVARDNAGTITLRYGDHDLPLADPVPDDALLATTPEALHALLEHQHYRLAWWRTGAATLNWRRFFEIADLVGVREERADVFEAVHALPVRLYREGWIDGLRIDHVDGLADPAEYCRRLRERLQTLRPGRPWIVVEKILGEEESLPPDWQVDGTTGYDFMSDVSAVLHDSHGKDRLGALWTWISGDARTYDEHVHAARRRVLARHLVAEFDWLCTRLLALARAALPTRDVTQHAIRRALTEFLTAFPVYRCYRSAADMRDAPIDDAAIYSATRAARRHLSPDELNALDLMLGCLRGDAQPGSDSDSIRARLQQLMTALAAKSTEDTAFYRYGRLLSRNEVGSCPGTLAMSPERFHARMRTRQQAYPHAMLAVATHDHKRGEDARMRLAVLSELADDWAEAVDDWESRLAPVLAASQAGPDGADRLMLYQTVLGAWPADPRAMEAEDAQHDFIDRIREWQRKAIREAKRHGNWTQPNAAYEAAADAFLDALATGGAESVLDSIGRFAGRIGSAAALNSLSQTLIELTAPGVPDRYQGNETWDFSLVDPDNRRSPDFVRLQSRIEDRAGWQHWLEHWRDGCIKQQIIRCVLQCRRERPALFAEGGYIPLVASCPMAQHVLAFARRDERSGAVVVATRLAARHVDRELPRIAPQLWLDTALPADGDWTDVLTGHDVHAHTGWLRLRDILTELPVALLIQTR